MRNFKAGMAPMEITPLGPFDTSSLRGKTLAMIQFAVRRGKEEEEKRTGAATQGRIMDVPSTNPPLMPAIL